MVSRNLGVLLAVLLATAFLGLSAAPASAAEEGVVNALASWQGQGRLFRTGDQHPLVARPTVRSPAYRGTLERHAKCGGWGGSPTAA